MLSSLREVWALPAIAAAALATGYGCVAAYGLLADANYDAATPVVRPLALVQGPKTPRFDVSDRVKLSRAIQAELARVDCYDGAQNGLWTPATRSAMQAFLRSANAQLPTDNPDEILFSLVEGHIGSACQKSCTGAVDASGKPQCAPRTVTAQAPSPRSDAPDTILIAAPAAHYRSAGDQPSQIVAPPQPKLAQVAVAERQQDVPLPPVRTASIEIEADTKRRASTVLASVEPIDRVEPARPAAALPRVTTYAPIAEPSVRPRRRSQRRLRTYNSRPPKFVRSFVRSFNKTFGGLGF